jgi:hypothetical protein
MKCRSGHETNIFAIVISSHYELAKTTAWVPQVVLGETNLSDLRDKGPAMATIPCHCIIRLRRILQRHRQKLLSS